MKRRKSIVIWRFIDGKPGHENQTRGLVQALAHHCNPRVIDIRPLSAIRAIFAWLFSSYPNPESYPTPDLILGAGHATHLSMLAVRRAFGGRAIVLMKPSLPMRFFDLCIIPEHDGVRPGKNVLLSEGVLNRMEPGTEKDPHKGLILLGGPSAHYGWDEKHLLQQIAEVIRQDPRAWIVATSRRTPESILSRLRHALPPEVDVVPHEQTTADWLPQQLSEAGVIWITEDSVSMVYEALSSGAACGLFPVPRKGETRITRGIDRLLQRGLLTAYEQWRETGLYVQSGHHFNEAARIAAWMCKSWDNVGSP